MNVKRLLLLTRSPGGYLCLIPRGRRAIVFERLKCRKVPDVQMARKR
jgi:hypothetical protein